MAKFSENAIKILNYVREHESDGITAKDIAKALGMKDRSVNATLTAAFTNHKSSLSCSVLKESLRLLILRQER